ncbi:HepT-like ribonuclease domain-containing protein [Oceanithermus sp.]
MYENAEKARRFLGELEGPEALQRDELRTRAIVRALEVIGEVAKRVPAEYRARHPKIPWREMAGMRDKLIHDYLGVDASVVWATVKESLPELVSRIEPLLAER